MQNAKGKEAVLEKLNGLGIPFELEEHGAAYTIEDMAAFGLLDKGMVAKNLFLRDAKGKRHFLVLLPGEKQADIKSLQEQIGCSRLSFASEEHLARYLGLTKGSVTPFGLINDEEHKVEVAIERGLAGQPRLGFHPNVNTATVWLAYEDFMKFMQDCGNSVRFVSL